MKPIDTQLTLGDVDDEYKEFIDKFKPKKTTDDCYTPENVYEAVKEWACKEYNVDPARVVRPFWPGADYRRFPYSEESVVIDNPPFSIIAEIYKFYNQHEIPYFLFSPYLTNLNSGTNTSHIITGTSIMYQNGAEVATAFITNMDGQLVRSVPALAEKIKAENAKNKKEAKKELPKYEYPPEVLTATSVGYMCVHGIEYSVGKEDCFFIRGLEQQKANGKSIFGGGFLLSERAAAERAAAERAAAERAAAERWALSEKELAIVKSLGKKKEG